MISHLGIMFTAGLGRWLSRSDLVLWHLRDHQPPATERPLTEVLRKRVCLVPDRRYWTHLRHGRAQIFVSAPCRTIPHFAGQPFVF